MKNKIIVKTLLIGIFMISMMGMISAAVITPTASQYIKSGTFMVNVTYVNGTNITSPTQFASGNSSIFFNGIMFSTYTGNRGCDATNCWALINSADTGIPEGTYLLNIALGNLTSNWYYNQTQTITIDRTTPTVDAKETTVETTRPINYKIVSGATDTCTLTHPNSNGITVTETPQVNTADYVQASTTVAGTYNFTCRDLAGNSATDLVVVSDPTGYAYPSAQAQTGNFFTKSVFNLGSFAVQMWMILLALIIWILWANNKK